MNTSHDVVFIQSFVVTWPSAIARKQPEDRADGIMNKSLVQMRGTNVELKAFAVLLWFLVHLFVQSKGKVRLLWQSSG